MGATQIPEAVAALIKEIWPDGMVDEFDTEESGFQDIHAKLERDLRKIRGASLTWQTESEEPVYWDDESDDEPPFDDNFQSYHVFFLVPDGDEFRYETETEAWEPSASLEEEEEWVETAVPGQGFTGCTAAVCLAAPVAMVDFSDRSDFADGTSGGDDIDPCIVSDETGERITPETYCRRQLSPEAFQKLDALRAKIVAVLQKHRLEVLDQTVLDLPVPGLKASQEVFLEKPIRVRDAFFFRGV